MKTKILSVLALGAVLFTACSSDDDGTPEVNDGQVRFSTGIDVSSTTQRVTTGQNGDIWQAGDSIGIYMLDNVTGAIVENAENIKYITWNVTNAGNFQSSSPTPIYYPVDATQKVKFLAYHPYRRNEGTAGPGRPTIKDYIFLIDTEPQNNQSMLDLMTATADYGGVGYDKNFNNPVELIFSHKMTKLIFNVESGDGVDDTDLTRNLTVTIKGLKTKAVYHVDTDVMEDVTGVADMTTRMTRPGEKYEGVVIPQSFNDGDMTVEFALNNDKNEVYVYVVPAKTFARGERYIFNVTLQKTGIEVRGTINDWDTQSPEENGVAK